MNIERIEKIINIYGFEELLGTLIKKYHSDGRNDYCSPYRPLLLLEIFGLAKEFGEPSEEYLDDFTTNFESFKYLYNGYYFVWTFGQGTDLAIYNSSKENILCL